MTHFFNVNDRVAFAVFAADESKIALVGTVTSTFFEPGDPVQGVSIRGDNGQNYGGLDAQDVYPELHMLFVEEDVREHNREFAQYIEQNRIRRG